MSNAEQVVRDFFTGLEATDYAKTRQAFAESVTDDCVWQNSGFPTAEGKEACLALFDQFNQGFGLTGLTVEWLACGVGGDSVVTERIDHLHNAAGERLMSLALAGTLVVRDGKIAAWRDYFDPRPLLG